MKKDEDIVDFKKAMKGVRPLVQDKVVLRKTVNIPQISETKFGKTQTNSWISLRSFRLLDLQDITEKNITSEEKLFFARTGLQHKLLQQLKQGKINISSSLDLHGLTINQARKNIDIFIQKAKINHFRFIHIIHGKSKSSLEYPILKNHVNHWLKQIPDVLAFCSATPKDGGTGAIYVLLKI